MGYPRRLYVPPDVPGLYHCVSRCVRRAFLCGADPATGRSFDHRKQWLEDRILRLAEIFAVAVHAYAVMSNHYHLVIEIDPTVARRWSDEEVARRWLALGISGNASEAIVESRMVLLLAQPERLKLLRERLGNLSWYMRYLNEPIARWANREDECTGRFWEGRFACQALLDESAALGCMAYVDLNPVRAGIAETPESGLHTSIRRRTRDSMTHAFGLRPISSSIRAWIPSLTTEQYLTLVDWTGRRLHLKNKGAIPPDVPPILERLSMRTTQWLIQVPATESHYWRAIGQSEALLVRARSMGLKWLRGVRFSRMLSRVEHFT
jgi:REP element-mobilizing transposase RayT